MNNLGKTGEKKAFDYLNDRGYKIIKRNYRKKRGEIDIIARADDIISFIEVKNWKKYKVEALEYSINKRKREKIINTAREYLLRNPSYSDFRMQFDVIYLSNGRNLVHIKEAFGVNG